MPESITKISQGSIDVILYIISACGAGIVFIFGFIFRHEKAIAANKKDIQSIKDIPIVTQPICDARYISLEGKIDELHQDVRLMLEKMIP